MRPIHCLLASALLAACSPRPSTTSAPSAPAALDCRGNEPFWNLKLRPDHAQLQWVAEEVRSLDYRGGWDASGTQWQGRAGDAALKVSVQPRQCADSMNDQTQLAAQAASFELPEGGGAASGCCWPTAAP